jgi:hypothetical protein
MIKIFLISVLLTLSVCATENPVVLLPWAVGFIVAIGLFFWGIYKALKTQKTVYTLALLPFILLIIGMFFI